MSNLLSPGKPVLTRFKVPGEGSYALSAELHAPLPRIPPVATATSVNKNAGGASSSGSAPPVSSPPAGPLGLPHVTAVSFSRRVSLTAPTRTSGGSTASTSAQTAPPTPPLNAQPASMGTSIFSLRKLTGFSSSLSSKFGTGSASSASDPNPPPVVTEDNPAPSRWFSTSSNATAPISVPGASNLAPATTNATSPRAPPRAALDSREPMSEPGAQSGVSSSKPSSRRTSSHTRDASPSSSSSRSRSRSRGERNRGDQPLGVLVYNAIDCVCAVDFPECKAPKSGAPARPPLEPMLMLNMRSAPTAHLLYKNDSKLVLIVGCANGEVIFYPDISSAATTASTDGGKRTRSSSVSALVNGGGSVHPGYFLYNREGSLNSSRVVALRLVPRSSHRFVVAHVDGALIVYDLRQKPHNNAIRAGPLPPVDTDSTSDANSSSTSTSLRVGDKAGSDKPDSNKDSKSVGGVGDKSERPGHRRTGSSAVTTVGQHEVHIHKSTRKKASCVAFWQVGCNFITDAAFAPVRHKSDPVLMAVAGRDGYVRIVDFGREAPMVAFRSYFGALLCVAWSPDGKYVAAGGEDDLVTVWCPAEERVVARLEGHSSWVSSVAWDRTTGGSSGRYRLASAGQDTKLILWDFDVNMLHHRTHAQGGRPAMVRLRSYAREPAPPPERERRAGKLARLRAQASSHSSTHNGDDDSLPPGAPQPTPSVIGALGRAEVPVVEPVLVHTAHDEPLTHVAFQDAGIVTADAAGTVKLWGRPPTYEVPPMTLGNKDDVPSEPQRGRAGTARSHVRRTRNADLD